MKHAAKHLLIGFHTGKRPVMHQRLEWASQIIELTAYHITSQTYKILDSTLLHLLNKHDCPRKFFPIFRDKWIAEFSIKRTMPYTLVNYGGRLKNDVSSMICVSSRCATESFSCYQRICVACVVILSLKRAEHAIHAYDTPYMWCMTSVQYPAVGIHYIY